MPWRGATAPHARGSAVNRSGGRTRARPDGRATACRARSTWPVLVLNRELREVVGASQHRAILSLGPAARAPIDDLVGARLEEAREPVVVAAGLDEPHLGLQRLRVDQVLERHVAAGRAGPSTLTMWPSRFSSTSARYAPMPSWLPSMTSNACGGAQRDS